MAEKVHVLAKDGMFLFRFNNGEFGSKWCGIWKKNKKYFDYFAFRLNGEFLSQTNFDRFEFYNTLFSRLFFKTAAGSVLEEVVCAEDVILVTVTPGFDADIEMEVGVNIRDRTENYKKGKWYSLDSSQGTVKIYNAAGDSAHISFDTGEFIKKEYYGIHSPGMYALEKGFSKYFDDGDVQNKYVPGYIKAKVSRSNALTVAFSTKFINKEILSKNIKNRLLGPKEYGERVNAVSSKFKNLDVINGGFIKDVIDALYSYSNFIDKEIYAGYPYFNEVWLRDALLVLPSFLSIGETEFVKSLLYRLIKEKTIEGMPNVFGGRLYPLDVPALFIIVAFEYFRWTNDTDTLKTMLPAILELLELGKKSLDNGLIHDQGKLTWMDSMNREYSLELQAMWANAFKCGSEIISATGGNSDFYARSESIIKNLKKYKRADYFSDQLYKDINSANQLFLPFYGVSDDSDTEDILENAENRLLTDCGVESLSREDKNYDANGYHNGAVWPILTEILAAAAYGNGKIKLGNRCMKILELINLGSQCSSRINEIYQPDGTPMGCPSQAWSIGLLPFIIDRYVLGIYPDASKNEIKIKKLNNNLTISRSIRINKQDITIDISNGRIKTNKKIVENGDYFVISW